MTDTRVALLAVAFLLVLLPWLLWRIRAVRAVAPVEGPVAVRYLGTIQDITASRNLGLLTKKW